MKNLQKKEKRQLASKNPRSNAAHKTYRSCKQGFCQHHTADMAFFHAKHIIKADFLLPSLHQKAVAEKKKDHRKHSQYENSHADDHSHIPAAPDIPHVRAVDNKQHNIKNSNTAHGGKNIGHKGSSVLFDICKSKPQKQSLTHTSHRLSLILSVCRKSSDTFPALFLCLCKSGEIPPRP